jgi:hypothetical protein
MFDQPNHSINLPLPLSLASSDSCPCQPKQVHHSHKQTAARRTRSPACLHARDLKPRPRTNPTHSGITTKTSTKMNVCVSHFPILCKPMPRPPAYRPPRLAVEVSTSPVFKPKTCPQFCRLRALAVELSTCCTRDMR